MIFEVDRSDLRHTRIVDTPDPVGMASGLADGQVLLEVESFALTSNNVSYAVAGDMLDYWGFFPTETPWGRVPVMGIGNVTHSLHADVAVGGRYFGFFPMAGHHVVDATPTRSGFGDGAAHRSGHAAAYRSFDRVDDDPAYESSTEGHYLLVRGLFITSFLIDDFLADTGLSDGAAVLVTSASSKTSIALAHCLAQRSGCTSVGITSARNAEFVESLGLYDSVITYDAIADLPDGPAVLVDMAGNASVRSAVHHHLGDALRHSSQVGATHWDAGGADAAPLPGPAPAFFFAPSQMKKRSDEWGRAEFDARAASALAEFVADTTRWLTVERSSGPDQVEAVYRSLLDGDTDPAIGHVLTMNDTTTNDTTTNDTTTNDTEASR
jgi:NADPH:quinone reductase-like Zn-dependent oxidoreductase